MMNKLLMIMLFRPSPCFSHPSRFTTIIPMSFPLFPSLFRSAYYGRTLVTWVGKRRLLIVGSWSTGLWRAWSGSRCTKASSWSQIPEMSSTTPSRAAGWESSASHKRWSSGQISSIDAMVSRGWRWAVLSGFFLVTCFFVLVFFYFYFLFRPGGDEISLNWLTWQIKNTTKKSA